MNKKKPRPKNNIIKYFKAIYPSMFKGVVLTMIPLVIILIINSVLMIGSIWDL